MIKLALISILIFFGILTAISLQIPSHIRISKAINLKAGSDSVIGLIKDTGKWHEWHPAYSSNKTNKPITVTPILQNDSEVVVQMQQAEKRPFTSGWQLHHFSNSDSVTLQWYMDFKLPWYPWQKFSSLFYENTFGVMMEQGLANLKQIEEKE